MGQMAQWQEHEPATQKGNPRLDPAGGSPTVGCSDVARAVQATVTAALCPVVLLDSPNFDAQHPTVLFNLLDDCKVFADDSADDDRRNVKSLLGELEETARGRRGLGRLGDHHDAAVLRVHVNLVNAVQVLGNVQILSKRKNERTERDERSGAVGEAKSIFVWQSLQPSMLQSGPRAWQIVHAVTL